MEQDRRCAAVGRAHRLDSTRCFNRCMDGYDDRKIALHAAASSTINRMYVNVTHLAVHASSDSGMKNLNPSVDPPKPSPCGKDFPYDLVFSHW